MNHVLHKNFHAFTINVEAINYVMVYEYGFIVNSFNFLCQFHTIVCNESQQNNFHVNFMK